MKVGSKVELEDMLLFAAVVREGSLTAAARTLGVSKQNVSARVARLEAALGVRLLERTTRSLRPTEAGLRYHQRCELIEDQIAEANEEAMRLQSEPAGRIRISTPSLFARRFLGPVLAALRTRHPGVRIELQLSERRVDLVEEGFDLAIRVGALDDTTLSARRLGSARAVFVVSEALFASRGAPTAETLHDWPCVGMRAVETWTLRDRRVRLEPQLVVGDLEVACEAVSAGAGLALLPRLVCGEALAAGRLREVLAEEAPAPIPVHIVYPSRAHLPARVRLLIDALVERAPLLDGSDARAAAVS